MYTLLFGVLLLAGQQRLRMLGVRIDCVDMEGTLDCIQRFVQERVPRRIATVNLEYLRHAQDCPGFLQAVTAADLAVADGKPLLWMARLMGAPLKGRVTGVDLAERCAELSAARGYRVYLLGAGPGVAQAAAEAMRKRYPGLTVAGTYTPPMGEFSEEEEERICAEIKSAGTDILLVALPTPRQELWNYANINRWQVPVVIGVGAAFDMLSGRVARAPEWMQRSGLEWFFRLLLEPRRLWRRYLVHDMAVMLRALVSQISP